MKQAARTSESLCTVAEERISVRASVNLGHQLDDERDAMICLALEAFHVYFVELRLLLVWVGRNILSSPGFRITRP